ncbi:hypothetical protein [Pseudomonas batumici]|uniref:Uncharacterized protein n=1 Tax=Pseudomonas batumici TaxID=226910 RepID=A0A0C2I605_9PSED|nr:hypothetical protein [Pseudomonas batumici]KIH80557.1 hypothetical protein UCMB321_5686 [Pseudomonas batumici]
MSPISGVIHHAVPNQTRVLPQEQLIEFQQIQKFGQILAHQYCVRRFSLHYPEAFLALRNIRTQIETVLADTPLTTGKHRPHIGQRITATARCMRLLDSRRAHALLLAGKKAEFRELLECEIEPAPDRFIYPVLRYLSDEQLASLSEIISNGCNVVSKLQGEFNFFDYYDPFALSTRVSGKTMLVHYLASKFGLHSVFPWAERLGRDHYWLHTKEAECDEEMAGIVCEYAYQAISPTSNVRIFGHNQHQVSINGIELKKHLVLAVPTDVTPTHIDVVLRDFRAALKDALIDNCGFYGKVSSPEFDNSLFMRNYDERTFLVSETKQYRSRLYGLWMWDLVNPTDKGCALTVNKAMDLLIPEAEKQQAKLAPDEKPYDSSTYKNYYDIAVKQITPKPTKRSTDQSPRDLDNYLTSGMAILGRRSSVMRSGAPDRNPVDDTD